MEGVGHGEFKNTQSEEDNLAYARLSLSSEA